MTIAGLLPAQCRVFAWRQLGRPVKLQAPPARRRPGPYGDAGHRWPRDPSDQPRRARSLCVYSKSAFLITENPGADAVDRNAERLDQRTSSNARIHITCRCSISATAAAWSRLICQIWRIPARIAAIHSPRTTHMKITSMTISFSTQSPPYDLRYFPA